MPYIGNVLTSFAVETGNITDQAVTTPKLSATGGTEGQVLGLDAGGNLVWTSDPAGQWVTSGNDIFYTTGNVGINTESPGDKLEINPASTRQGLTIKNTGATFGGVNIDTNRTDADQVLGEISFLWNNTRVSSIQSQTGSDTTNKDDGHLIFSTSSANNNTERMRIDSSGRLLVGTNSASYTVTAVFEGNSANSDNQGQIHLQKGNTTVADGNILGIVRFGATGDRRGADIRGIGDGTWTADSSHPTRLMFLTTADGATAPTERMVINNSGNVGIGNFTDPNARLEIRGDRNAVIRLTNERTTESAGQTLGRLEFFGSDTSGPGAGVRSSITARTAESDGTGSTLAFSTGTATENNQEAMRINQDQNLLIGLTSRIDANARLQIADDEFPADIILARNDTSVASNSIGRIWFYGNDSDGTFEQVAQIGVDAEGSHTSDSKPGMMRFFTTASGSTTTTERLRITANGTLELRNSPGISFAQIQGAPDAGTSNSEVLDSYEQGTFTPAYRPTSGSFTTINYAEQLGAYTKIGNRVFYNIRIRTSSLTVGTASGVLSIGGFPFTNVNSSSYGRNAASFSVVTGWGTAPSGGDVEINSDRLILRKRNTTATDNTNSVEVSHMNTGVNQNQLWISGFYITET